VRARVVGPLLVAAATLGCAQPGTPPGGEIDRIPPRVRSVTPAAFDTLTDPDAPVVIRFDERISERLEGVRNWEEAVLVSPITSPVVVDAGRSGVEVSLVRGWEPNQVYRVTVRPVFRDLFGNQRREPITLVFSTGADIPQSALAGFVVDGITRRAVPDARVEAVRRIDETRYVAVTDTAGFFAMPFMPAGAFDVRAWIDQDRSMDPGGFEPQDSTDLAFAVGDTAVVELALLRPDTTPARLARAEPMDSLRVRLHFDDYFAAGAVSGAATLHSLPDSTLLGAGELVHASRLDSLMALDAAAAALRETTQAMLDSLRQAAPVADTTPAAVAARESAAASIARGRLESEREKRERSEAGQGARAASEPLPAQQLILLSPVPLRPGASYYVRVSGLTNIQGVAGGGGVAGFEMPAARGRGAGEAVPADTTAGGGTGGGADGGAGGT